MVPVSKIESFQLLLDPTSEAPRRIVGQTLGTVPLYQEWFQAEQSKTVVAL